MSEMKFQIGTPVFFYTMLSRIPGVVESAELNENGAWIYVIRINETLIARNVAEHNIEIRKIFDAPKYSRGDKVKFSAAKDKQYVGYIEIVDPYGTFEQAEEPSYDILVKGDPGCLYKHIRESGVLGLAE